jgi:hypothetical protein
MSTWGLSGYGGSLAVGAALGSGLQIGASHRGAPDSGRWVVQGRGAGGFGAIGDFVHLLARGSRYLDPLVGDPSYGLSM